MGDESSDGGQDDGDEAPVTSVHSSTTLIDTEDGSSMNVLASDENRDSE